MGGLSDGKEVMKTQKHKVVASVLASPPQTGYQSIEEYYANICPQLLDLISPCEAGEDEESREIRAVACQCVRSISERSLILSRRYLFDVAMAPMLKLSDKNVTELPTEEEIGQCVSLLHVMFVAISVDPSPLFCGHLDPCIPALLELHCSICFGVSHLRGPVKDLLEKYLRTSSRFDAVAALRYFAFSDQDPAGLQRYRPMRGDVKFVAGDTGGVKIIRREGAEENFYVSDDEKSIAMVDLLDSCSKDIGVEFFMSLLQDLSRLMSKGGAKNGMEMDQMLLKATEDAGADGGKFESIEQKLLAIEEELDQTMLDLRRHLMVIRLLGLLSEDEKLQERLSKDSDRLLDFVGLTLQRAAIGCQQKQQPADPKSEQELDEGPTMLETQSVTMALTLLSLKVTQPRNQVSAEEWRKLGAFSGDLRSLSEQHPESRVRSLAGKMLKLIATHGVISDSQVSSYE